MLSRIYLSILAATVFVGCSQSSIRQAAPTSQPTAAPSQKIQVTIIGGLHQGHLTQKYYTVQAVRDILIAIHPDMILHECPPKFCLPSGAPFPAPQSIGCETWACNQAAAKLNIPQRPFDRPDRDDYRNKINYWEHYNRAVAYIDAWAESHWNDKTPSLEKSLAEQLVLSFNFFSNESANLVRAEQINSDVYDYHCMMKDEYMWELLPEYVFSRDPSAKQIVEDCRIVRDEAEQRNKIMAENIARLATKYRCKRVAVVVGAGHRHALRLLLDKQPTIEYKEFYILIDEDAQKAGTATQSAKK